MTENQILQVLDKYAKDYNFPVLDNYNFDLAQCRLSVFRDDNEWIIVFEIVGVNPSLYISNDIYAYGNSVESQGLIIGLDDIVSLPNEEDLFDDEGNFLITPFHLDLIINSEPLIIKPTEGEYLELGIQTELFNPTKLIRYLSSKYKEKFWLEPLDLLNEINMSEDFKLFYQTDEWEHTDEEKPSENKFFQSLAKAIVLNDKNLIQFKKANTHWSNWTWSDFEKQEED
ncbi:DUF7003 family protein [Priestia megaterium]|uniref:DUF7003 family protein n=1 Tax=Priestia megaterium TaxID=1404 RepID=UPI00237AC972|nr:hypothetical protein [Priestia megaterium]MDD9793568.1 hypothetical protein [Priestia megaterium]